MTITPIPAVAPAIPADRVASAQPQPPVPQQAQSEPAPKAPFQPAPALRPTIQDKIDIDRTLISLRER
jgi:hypothetical protein